MNSFLVLVDIYIIVLQGFVAWGEYSHNFAAVLNQVLTETN